MRPEPRAKSEFADETFWEEGPLAVCDLETAAGEGEGDGRQWFVQEAWVGRAGGGRGLHGSRLWAWDSGVLVATTWQDGLVRFGEGKL